MGRRRRANLPLIVGAALILIGAALLCYLHLCKTTASYPDPNPHHMAVKDQGYSDEFPQVDWAYWQGVNPDVCGWVSVPGTDLSLPICKASASDPDFYLDHDVTKAYNVYGCPYLDAGCKNGFDSYEALVFGHHMNDDAMFSLFADYSDPAFLQEHKTILLQTPTQKIRLRAVVADVLDADVELKMLDFGSPASFNSWWTDMVAKADCVSPDAPQAPGKVTAFCTCSYRLFGSNERTVVYAVAV